MAIVSILFARTLAEPDVFPDAILIDFEDPVNAIVDWFTSTFATITA